VNQEVIEKISRKVYQSHPEVAGSKPKISKQATDRFLLLFKSKAALGGNKVIEHSIRVISNEKGDILKISSARG